VKKLYMNTPETLHGGANEDKADYLYERLPKSIGFTKEKCNLRGKTEEFWVYNLENAEKVEQTKEEVKKVEKPKKRKSTKIALDIIPRFYQGAVINILGKKEFYTKTELKKVLAILKKEQEKKGKAQARFFYDWSKSWSGGQSFFEGTNKNRHDTVVLQKIPSELQEFMTNDPILAKFFSFILSTSKHFQQDVISFILVNKIDKNKWVINEIQTDCINLYMKERNKLRADKELSKNKKADWATIKDMLEANGKNKWIAKLEEMPDLKQKVLENPNLINELCDNSHDLEEWIAEYNRRNVEALQV
jgi:hypothetical protein